MVLNEWDIINMEENGYMLKYEICPEIRYTLSHLVSEDVSEEIDRVLWDLTIQFYVDIAELLDGE